MLMALEEKFQLGTAPSTLSTLMGLASSAGNPPEIWMKSLLRFLCAEGYLLKEGETFVVLRSVPRFKTNKEFVQRCVDPYKNPAEKEEEGATEPEVGVEQSTSDMPPEETAPQDAPVEEGSSTEESVLVALTERVLELTEATRGLRDAVAVQTSSSEALRLEIAGQREEFRSLTSNLQAEVMATRTNNDSNAAAILEWINKSETIGEHSKAVLALRESVKELVESVRPLKEGATEHQKTIETTAAKYKEEMAVSHREIRDDVGARHKEMQDTLAQLLLLLDAALPGLRRTIKRASNKAKERESLWTPSNEPKILKNL